MNVHEPAARPPLHMIDTEAHVLAELAARAEERAPELSAMLIAEVERAILHDAAEVPPDVVTMNATVDFIDEGDGAERTIRLVFPSDADISAGRVSIMTPVGAALIGLRQGQSIVWPDRDGHTRKLTVVKVAQERRAA